MNKATIKSEKFGGFAAEKVQAGNLVQLWQQMSITTDHPSFYLYVNQIDMLMLHPARIAGDAITHAFIVQHADDMMDIYTNFDRDISIQGTLARPINQGDLIHVDDVVDIHRYEIPTLSIQPDDAVLCILKLGWKYGLFFDVTRKTSEAAIWEGLGQLYHTLHVDRVLDNIRDRLRKSTKPHIMTEGKTDWKHLEAARRVLDPELVLGYSSSESELGDTALLQFCERASKFGPPYPNKVMAIFDRDNPVVLRKLVVKPDCF